MSLHSRTCLYIAILGISSICFNSAMAIGVDDSEWNESFNLDLVEAVSDTIPIKDRYTDFITNDYYNPFDITPSIIEQKVEYDFASGQYIVMEKIGDEYYRTPTYLTMQEYLDWQQKKQKEEHFRKLSGIASPDFSSNLKLDPMADIDIDKFLSDRLFGGSEIDIKPTGNIDIGFSVAYYNRENPNIDPSFQRQLNILPLDPFDINMGVDGKIGDKLNLGFNYNTQASFDFDQRLNLNYGSELFDEDDIIKTIEAGNISFPLNSQLIQGSQDLFGLKTELQFGKFWLTAMVSQSRTEQEEITLENGKLIQKFEIRPDEYDENRHFFLGHYFEDIYEDAMSNIPQVKSLVNINNIEVWVTVRNNENLQNAIQVVALDYIAESDTAVFSNPQTLFQPLPATANSLDKENRRLPDNRNSNLFTELVNDKFTRENSNTSSSLKSKYGMTQGRDFELTTMRKLNSNEYSYNPQLGVLSLRRKLETSQVLGVSYEYTYTLNGNEVYKVGEMTNETIQSDALGADNIPSPDNVIYVKMLKSMNQVPSKPEWDLMMKNVYQLSSSQLTQEEFLFDIFFEDNQNVALRRYIPEPSFRSTPLLNLFQLDRLNNYGDPQEDGVFDFIDKLTVNTETGSIFFPVLQPFGSALLRLFEEKDPDNAAVLYSEYGYPQLYELSPTNARQALDKNRFLIKGQVKSNTSSEIYLGTFGIPEGSVVVRAGSQILKENIDYTIDYGIGRIKIINDSYLQQGIPIKVSYENQGLFGLQQKTMIGLRGEYRFNENFIIGGTYMNLFERPFSQKVNIGNDPINNRMYGLDISYTGDAPGITKLVDKLPFYSTNAPSSITLNAEVAALRPGASGAINIPNQDKPVISIDDFEGATSSVLLGSRGNTWSLASPPLKLTQDLDTIPLNNYIVSANRALMNWGVIFDTRARNAVDNENPYTRRFDQTELFPLRQVDRSQLSDLFTFDVHYYPSERGPYNFDLPEGIQDPISGARSEGVDVDPLTGQVLLKAPTERWAGIQRSLVNNDFEASNYEYIEFWMLNPFMDRADAVDNENDNGFLYFDLGNVSEDILPDGLQFYENAVAAGEMVPTIESAWGNVPINRPNIDAFDREFQEQQDIGLDGLDNDGERVKFAEYVQAITSAGGFVADPANDDFVSYLSPTFGNDVGLLERFRRFNHPEGNAPLRSSTIGIGNTNPDNEDINGNRSLESNESFYRYRVRLASSNGQIDVGQTSFITDQRTTNNGSETWYRFQIPIQQIPDSTRFDSEVQAIGGIEGFRSIQFIRMSVTGFSQPKTFRMADFELVRNQWRRLPLENCGEGDETGTAFVVNEVGLQENSDKQPYNYVLPEGIKQERIYNVTSNLLQDENSLSLSVCNMPDTCRAMISKLTQLDLRQFDDLQLFAHAESLEELPDTDSLFLFVRVGKDFTNNFYEYEIPLTFSDSLRDNGVDYDKIVWHPENMIDIPLSIFPDIKKSRNNVDFSRTEVYQENVLDTIHSRGKVKIKGNPSLGYIKGMVIGLRSKVAPGNPELCAEVWVNELRLAGFNNRGGLASVGRVDIQLADLGNVTVGGNYSSIGWGQIGEQLQERALEQTIEYDIATNLELGKFFPEKWKLSVPFYYQYAKSISTPEFDPLELDLTKEDLLENPNLDENEITDIVERQKDRTSISTINFTNVKKQRTKQGKPMPWDISNVSASYSFTRTKHSDAIVKNETTDDQRAGLTYTYSTKPATIQPFKGIKSKALRFIKEINFNPIPNSISFNTQMRRYKNSKIYRIPDPTEGFTYAFDDKRFDWTRNYSLGWDLAKSLRLNYDATAVALVDELKQVGVSPTPEERRWEDPMGNDSIIVNGDMFSYSDLIDEDPDYANRYRNDNLKDFGRMKTYSQGVTVNYTLPFKFIPGFNWISSQAQYTGGYAWTAASLSSFEQANNGERISLGNTIQNNQRRTLRTTFDFEKLYDKIGYFKTLQGKNNSRSRSRAKDTEEEGAEGSTSRKKQRKASVIEKILVRPLLSIRKVKFNYSEDMETVIPGFTAVPKFLGIAGDNQGLGFALGIQPDINKDNQNNYLMQLSDDITVSQLQNRQVIQNNTQTYEMDIELEPWKDLTIDIDFKKSFTENHSEFFINLDDTNIRESAMFEQLTGRDIGSYNLTYGAINTLFSDPVELFQQFEDFRRVISSRLAEIDGNTAPHANDIGFAEGYGAKHIDVIIPAFIAAYTGQDPNIVNLDLTEDVKRRNHIPKPNWSLRYNGLSKIQGLKKLFSNFSITHAYKGNLTVNDFRTDLQFDANPRFFIDPNISTSNYFARFEIPRIVIDEQFAPLIGIDFKTTTDLNFNLEYGKSRRLELATDVAKLTQTSGTQFTVGAEWTFQDVEIGFLTGGKKKKRRKRDTTEEDTPTDEDTAEDRSSRSRTEDDAVVDDQNRLAIGVDVQLRDDRTDIFELDKGLDPEPIRGTKAIQISPTLDYDINKNFTLRFFVNFDKTTPYNSNSFPVTNISGGLVARFNLN